MKYWLLSGTFRESFLAMSNGEKLVRMKEKVVKSVDFHVPDYGST